MNLLVLCVYAVSCNLMCTSILNERSKPVLYLLPPKKEKRFRALLSCTRRSPPGYASLSVCYEYVRPEKDKKALWSRSARIISRLKNTVG
jgi:hypothetical protein